MTGRLHVLAAMTFPATAFGKARKALRTALSTRARAGHVATLATLLAAALQLVLVGCTGPAEVHDDARLGTDEAEAPTVVWEEDWQAAFDRARSEGRIVVATFRADWCIWCHRLEQGTLSEPDVARFLTSHAVALRLDVDGDGRSQASEHDVRTLPTVIGFSADGSELGRIVGYSRPQRFLSSVEAWTGPQT